MQWRVAAIPDGRSVVFSGMGHLDAFAGGKLVPRQVRPFLDGTTESAETARREPGHDLHR